MDLAFGPVAVPPLAAADAVEAEVAAGVVEEFVVAHFCWFWVGSWGRMGGWWMVGVRRRWLDLVIVYMCGVYDVCAVCTVYAVSVMYVLFTLYMYCILCTLHLLYVYVHMSKSKSNQLLKI